LNARQLGNGRFEVIVADITPGVDAIVNAANAVTL
jgi:hypothetical protein